VVLNRGDRDARDARDHQHEDDRCDDPASADGAV
jgi:hypothetical protein